MLQLFSKRKNKGFTLIELLVVIAIIGILSTVILVGMNAARAKAKDTRMVNDMTQIRNEAEMYYDSNNQTYTGFTPSTALTGDIATQGGTNYLTNVNTAGSAYCAEVQLNSGWYCVDSTLTGKRYTSNPSCVGGATPDYTCD